MNRLRTPMYLGSPKGKISKKDWFNINNVDTPSNKHANFDKKNKFKGQINTAQSNHFSGTANNWANKKAKHKPQSTKHLISKVNFSKDKLNLSRAERQSGFADSRFSTHQYSVHGSSVQSDGFSKYKGLKKGGIALGKGKANRIKKGSVFEWIFGGFFNDFFCYNRLF